MPATYEPIASTTLGSNSQTVTFSSIASTWTDLRLVICAATIAGSHPSVYLDFNSDQGNNYSQTFLAGSGSSAFSDRQSSTNVLYGVTINASSTPTLVTADIMGYANTNVFKTTLWTGAHPSDRAARAVSLWRNTAAITSITVNATTTGGVATFRSGGVFALYGIKAA